MSRPQLSPEQRQKIFASFVNAAWSLMKEGDGERLTLRRVSAMAGHNSATLYQHFRDLDELTAYASLRYLKEYGLQLVDSVHGMGDPVERYYTVWNHFCRQAFRYPTAFYTLYFGRYSGELDQMWERYYSVFPEDRTALAEEEVVDRLFTYASISQRSLTLLPPIVEAGLLDKEGLDTRNEILIYCFKELLSRKMREGDALDSEWLVARQLDYVRIVLGQ